MQWVRTIESVTNRRTKEVTLERIFSRFLAAGISSVMVKTSVGLSDLLSGKAFCKSFGFVAYSVSNAQDIAYIVPKLVRVSLWHKSRFYILFFRKENADSLGGGERLCSMRNLEREACASVEPLDNDLHFFADSADIKRIIFQL